MGLIFLLLYLWMQYSMPPKKDQNAEQTNTVLQDSLAATSAAAAPAAPVAAPIVPDSIKGAYMAAKYGAFAPAAAGVEQLYVLENELMRVAFSSKGGRIKEIFLKKFEKINSDTAGNDFKSPVRLLEDGKNRYFYELPVQGSPNGIVYSDELNFSAQQTGNSIVFKAEGLGGVSFQQTYTISPDNYTIEYGVSATGLPQARFTVENYLDKLEKNQAYERTMSSVYYKASNESSNYCDCRSDAAAALGAKPVQWFAHANQFFNTTFLARDFAFNDFIGQTKMFVDAEPDLKMLKTMASVPLDKPANMTIYAGPNEFERLRSFKASMEDIIPFGASIFGAINRWIIHPILEFLARFIGNQGIVILMLTLIVKLLVYPLTYRMVYSQARMAALKPQIEALRKKHGDDQQALSVETMKMYSEFRVNPLGGCLPIFLQMPIWFALYRFFPAAIEFRQEGFLWATDLSSYDVAFKLPFYLYGFGYHISAFTLIWVATTLWYTWYSMKQMDPATMANDQMKVMRWMQYLMPVMFMFFFNNFASGLTLYLCFSNILNISQTVLTKQFLINHDKIKAELEANKNKPKKTTGLRARFEDAMKEAQRQQAEQKKQPKKK